jgi:hypothetical protein
MKAESRRGSSNKERKYVGRTNPSRGFPVEAVEHPRRMP